MIPLQYAKIKILLKHSITTSLQFEQGLKRSNSKLKLKLVIKLANVQELFLKSQQQQLTKFVYKASNDINIKILKDIKDQLCVPIHHIRNISFAIEIFPGSLKVAYVFPIHEKGKNLPNNYRPISLL